MKKSTASIDSKIYENTAESAQFLTLSGVGKEYKSGSISVQALKDVSFSLNDGEFVVILGSSGAGKTTLLNLLGGMDNATGGQIILDGRNISSLNKRGL